MSYAYAGDLTQLDLFANQTYPLGFKVQIPAANRANARQYQTEDVGDGEFVYVYNDSGVTIPAGDLVARKAATVPYRARTAPIAAPVASLLGVALQAIPTGYCGFIQCKGYVALGINSEAVDMRNVGLYTGATAGRVALAAGAAADAEQGPLGLGLVDNSAGAAGALCAAYIACPMA